MSLPKPSSDRPRQQARDRLRAILGRIDAQGSVTVAEIVRDFGVSDMTARRDLAGLEKAGLVERVHGGALSPGLPAPAPAAPEEPGFVARAALQAAQKDRIARAAARVILGHRTIAIDGGTTTRQLARNLDGLVGARIFTTSLHVADALSQSPNDVYVPGGRVQPDELTVSGRVAIEQLGLLHFDIAVIGVTGLTAAGFFDNSIEDTEIKRALLERSQSRMVLCDSGKFGRPALVKVCELAEVGLLVTDAAPPEAIGRALALAGVEVVVAA